MSRVISLKQKQYENFYNGSAACRIDLTLDTVYVPVKKTRDIAKELQLGYMKLLSNNQMQLC